MMTPFCKLVGNPNFLKCGSMECENCFNGPLSKIIVCVATFPDRAKSVST